MTQSKKVLLLTGCAVLAMVTLPALAHHAVQAQFDVGTLDSFVGKLVKMELVNPHPYLYFDVGENEESVHWEIEAPALMALRRAGLLKRLQLGQVYTVNFAPARNGQPRGLIRSIVLPDGQTIVTSSADDYRR